MGGTGRALAFPAMNVTSISAVPIRKIGQATGLYNVTRQVGGAFGVALVATVLTQRQVFHAALLGQAMAALEQAPAFVAHLAPHFLAGGASAYVAHAQARAVLGLLAGRQATIEAFQDVFRFAGAVAILGAFPAFFMKPRDGDAAEQPEEAMIAE